jgi:hypothetical protein
MGTTASSFGVNDRHRSPAFVAGLALVAAHFAFLMCFFAPAISTPDASSYFGQAKLIARTGRTYIEPESPLQYVGVHWNHVGGNRYYCTHAPGLSLLMAPVYKVFGPGPTVAMNPLFASLSLLGLFLLCRLWVGQWWALLAAAFMAVNPFANEHAHFGDAHSAVCFFLVWGLFLTVKWVQQRSVWQALAAGAFFGIIPTIRYADVFYLPAVAVFVLLNMRRDRRSWAGLLAGVAGLAIPLGWLCIRNHLAFGAFWRTGYSQALDAGRIFALRYFLEYALPHLRMLLSDGCGVVFALGVLGIAILCGRKDTWKQGVVFTLLVVSVTVLYMAYFWGPDRQSMRYLLPTFYVYTIATVWLLRELSRVHAASALVGSLVVLAVTIFWGVPPSVMSIAHLHQLNGVLSKVTSVVENSVEPGSILVANEGLSQHLDFVGRWRLADAGMLRFFGPERGEPRGPDMPIPERSVLDDRRTRIGLRGPKNIKAAERYGPLREEELFSAFSRDIWEWAGSERKVYLLAKEHQIGAFERELPPGDRLVRVERIELGGGRRPETAKAGRFEPGRPMPGKMRELARGERRGGVAPEGLAGPSGPFRIFDFAVDDQPLFLVEWRRTGQP